MRIDRIFNWQNCSLAFLLISLIACKKDNSKNSPPVLANFFTGTEWVGVHSGAGYQYPGASDLKFNADNSITIYSHFVFFTRETRVLVDSVSGEIGKVDLLSDGRTQIQANFKNLGSQTIYITSQKKLLMVSADPGIAPTLQMDLFSPTRVSLEGIWNGIPWHETTAYPDVAGINFNSDGTTSFTRNGNSVMLDPTHMLKAYYSHVGARVYFYGYNDLNGGNLVTYFGVLLPDGKHMYVDSRSELARLPLYTTTSEPYGPAGATPVIMKP